MERYANIFTATALIAKETGLQWRSPNHFKIGIDSWLVLLQMRLIKSI